MILVENLGEIMYNKNPTTVTVTALALMVLLSSLRREFNEDDHRLARTDLRTVDAF